MSEQVELTLVAGATGQQGGAVARQLLQKGHKVRALTRHPDRTQDLRRLGAEIVVGNMTNRASLHEALRGVTKVFLVTTPFGEGTDAELDQGTTMAEASRDAGVNHLVFSSVAAADQDTHVPYAESKFAIEKHILELSLPCTILRPVSFMDNFGSRWMVEALESGVLRSAIRPTTRVQMIAVEDIGRFAVTAFEQPNKFIGETTTIAGDELTYPEALAIISEVSGRTIVHEPVPYAEAERTVGRDYARLLRWFNERGTDADLRSLTEKWGFPLTTFRQFVEHSSFAKYLKGKRAA